MTERKFYLHRWVFEMISEEPLPSWLSAREVIHMAEEGDCVGQMFEESLNEELDGQRAADELYGMGSEPGFFLLDDDGNDIEDE